MRILNGIACVLLGLGSGYFMFIKAETDDDLIAGFMLLMIRQLKKFLYLSFCRYREYPFSN